MAIRPVGLLTRDVLDPVESDDQFWVWDTSAGVFKRAPISAVQTASKLLVAISPSITADQNNWNPSGLADADWLRVTATITGGIIRITGLAAGSNGQTKLITNLGAGFLILSGEDSNSTAANRFSTLEYIPFWALDVGASALLVYDSSISRWRVYQKSRDSDGFTSPYREGFNDLTTFVQTSVSGTAAAATRVASSGEALVNLTTGSTSSGRAGSGTKDLAAFSVGNSNRMYAHGAIYTQDAVSDGTNRYTVRAGLMDSLSGDPTDGLFLRGVDNVNSGKFQFCARGASSETAVDTGITFAGVEYWDFYILLSPNLATPRADLYMSDTANDYNPKWVCSVTGANLPVAAEHFGFGYSIVKSVGGTARTLVGYSFQVT